VLFPANLGRFSIVACGDTLQSAARALSTTLTFPAWSHAPGGAFRWIGRLAAAIIAAGREFFPILRLNIPDADRHLPS
jgi:hypothetical protein